MIEQMKKDSIKYYDSHILKNKKILKEVNRIVIQLQIDKIDCARSKKFLNNELYGVSFLLYSAGLGVSGEGQLIEYETMRSKEYWKGKKRVSIPWRTKNLIEGGWSIVHMK